MKWVRHISYIGDMRNEYKILDWKSLKGRGHLGQQNGIQWRAVLMNKLINFRTFHDKLNYFKHLSKDNAPLLCVFARCTLNERIQGRACICLSVCPMDSTREPMDGFWRDLVWRLCHWGYPIRLPLTSYKIMYWRNTLVFRRLPCSATLWTTLPTTPAQ